MILSNRRAFFAGAAAVIAAPAIVRAGSLMTMPRACMAPLYMTATELLQRQREWAARCHLAAFRMLEDATPMSILQALERRQ